MHSVREDTTSPEFQGQRDGVFYSSEYDALVLQNDDLISNITNSVKYFFFN